MHVLITGCAGFIGFHLARRLLEAGHVVTGLDNLNNYYDPGLKQDRLKSLRKLPQAEAFEFVKADLADQAALRAVFKNGQFTHVVNLAAQAGVRYSLQNPASYIQSNLTGFGNLLEECRHASIGHLVFASSSSVYGMNRAFPYSTHQNVDHPVSLYAATKKGNELMAHSYSHLFGLPATGLRFFTVYGPWGRPDMALYLFTSAILQGRPLKLFNHGKLQRDFTYIDEIVESVMRVLEKPARPNPDFDAENPDPASSSAPWRIYNIGNSQPVALMDFVTTLEDVLGRKAHIEYLPMQAGDVEATLADTDALRDLTGELPPTPLRAGLEKYVQWHREYYGDN